jgi:hypothetical protein
VQPNRLFRVDLWQVSRTNITASRI